MSRCDFHLVQFNTARARFPPEDPRMRSFLVQLLYINSLADGSTGFVWRLQTEAGNSIAVRPYEDDRILITYSIWESIEDVFDFTYRSLHAWVMKDRKQWFERIVDPYIVLWWVPAGEIPPIEEAVRRLDHLRRHGPSQFAFDFKHRFPPPVATTVTAAAGATGEWHQQ
jgi:hypothetical protein